MKYLIFGSRGQLGRELVRHLESIQADYKAYDIDDLDITDFDKVGLIFDNYRPDIVINATAYNLVDEAELNKFDAFNINAFAVKNIAGLCYDYKAKLIHYSTDYVFDGNKSEPYTETDITNPVSEYGKSKLSGEEFIRESLSNALIFRLSWLYGNGRQNFIYKFMQWSKNNRELKIVTDEISVPTSVDTVKEITFNAIKSDISGLYHTVNTGYTSRYEWAMEIKRILGLDNKIIPAKITDFNLPANRPKFSAMSNKLISEELNISIPNWRDSMDIHIMNLKL